MTWNLPGNPILRGKLPDREPKVAYVGKDSNAFPTPLYVLYRGQDV